MWTVVAVRTLALSLISVALAAPAHALDATPASGPRLHPHPHPPQAGTGAEILWDAYGIPHIYGRDVLTVVRGLGYAQMANHAETVLGNIAQARGRAAEYFGAGPNNAYVESDTRVRTYDIPNRARQWLRQGGTEQQRLLQAAAQGMNQYAASHAGTIAPAFRQVLPVLPEDILALFQHTVNFTFQPEQSGANALLAGWKAGDGGAAKSAALAAAARNGSNGWALSPSKTASGHAVLMGNPHLPWGNNQPVPGLGLYQWMEVQLVVGNPARPEVNISGVTFVGGPFIGIGYNDYLGWSHTNNTIKNVDLYELQLGRNDSYAWEGGLKPLTHRVDQIKVRQADGSLVARPIDVSSSVHGPIVARRGDKALAMRVAGLDAPSPVTQYWGMARARGLLPFIEANSALQMPFFNVLYADRQGHIMYLFGGRQPVRAGGTFSDWTGILPGDKKNALWTSTLRWTQLPRAINPPGGFVQNCNDAPWTATFPQVIQPAWYPGWIAPEFMELRAQHCASFLLSRSKFTLDQLLTGKMSTRMLLAERVLPDLLAAAQASDDETARTAAHVLAAWDGQADAASRGAVLFERWYRLYAADPAVPRDKSLTLYFSHPAFRTPWDPKQPLVTPQGLGETTIAVQSLIKAAQQVRQQYGALDVPWGEVHRTVLATRDAAFQQVVPVSNDPLSGADDVFGPVRTIWPFPAPDGKSQWHYGGDGYVQLVEFTPEGPRAQALLSYGNASRPGSAHVTDQLGFFNAKRLRPVDRSRSEVESHAVSRERY